MKILFAFLMCFSISSFAAGQLSALSGKVSAPPLKLLDTNNVEHNLKQYLGKVVLIQFWVSYCEPCITEMPSVNRLKAKLNKAGVPFKILAVNLSETKKEVDDFIKTVKTDFTILMDPEGTAQKDWNVYSAPKSYILNKKGEVIFYVNGAIEWDTDDVIKLLSNTK